MRQLTQEQARLIMDAHEIEATLNNEEDADLLEQNNPDLLPAYLNLQAIAPGLNGEGRIHHDEIELSQPVAVRDVLAALRRRRRERQTSLHAFTPRRLRATPRACRRIRRRTSV